MEIPKIHMHSTPKVTLLSWTTLPLETVYSVWEASKNEEALITPQQVRDTVDAEKVRELFRAVIEQHIPVGEHVDFVFMIEGISVSWREQAVRHRIGTSISPERLGLDIVPDLADSTWWSQSMRIQNMGQFATRRQYRMPQTILDHKDSERLRFVFDSTMGLIEEAYNELVKQGVPMEDARELIPLGATHRISWRLNISSLQHIVGKRGCWILQLGIWGPVIEGMIAELAAKVDPIFQELVTPPCIKGDEFKGCVYMEENRRRYTGDDAHPPCPLHVAHHHVPSQTGDDPASFLSNEAVSDMVIRTETGLKDLGVPMAPQLLDRAEDYRKFWGRDPFTGKRQLPVVP